MEEVRTLLDMKLPKGFKMDKSIKTGMANFVDQEQCHVYRRLMARAQFFAEEQKKRQHSKGDKDGTDNKD